MKKQTPSIKQPEQTGVIIIGGGIVGVTAALFLAEAGVSCVLFEKGQIAGEQSSRNWGWIRQQMRDFSELPLMTESAQLWERIAGELDEDIGYRKGGCTYATNDEAELAAYAKWQAHSADFGVNTQILDKAQTRTLLDNPHSTFLGSIHTPEDAYAEPELAVPAMAKLAKHRGATIIENTAVRTLFRTAGKICGVYTEHGPIKADSVILAGGIWSRSLLENEGVSFPQLAITSSVLRTTKAPAFTTSTIGSSKAAIKPRLDGGYTVARTGAAGFDLTPAALRYMLPYLPILKERWRILKLNVGPAFFGPLGHHRWNAEQHSPFEWVRTMNPEPDQRLLSDVMQHARKLYPQLSQTRVVQSWAGMIDVMPDEVCSVGTLPELPGLVLATGMSGHGFGLGPAVGKLATQYATGSDRPEHTEKLSPMRFR